MDEVSIGKPPEMVEFPVFPVPKDWRDVTMGKPPGVVEVLEPKELGFITMGKPSEVV